MFGLTIKDAFVCLCELACHEPHQSVAKMESRQFTTEPSQQNSLSHPTQKSLDHSVQRKGRRYQCILPANPLSNNAMIHVDENAHDWSLWILELVEMCL